MKDDVIKVSLTVVFLLCLVTLNFMTVSKLYAHANDRPDKVEVEEVEEIESIESVDDGSAINFTDEELNEVDME